MKSTVVRGCLIVVCYINLCQALYGRNSDVFELTASNFDIEVVDSNELWLVEFYAPWCGHCQKLAPEWEKAAKALKGVVNVGAVDMDVHKGVGAPYNIRGFPTIKIFGTDKAKPEDYQGGRTADAIVDAALNTLKKVVKSRLSGGGRGSGEERRSRQTNGEGESAGDDVIELTDSNFSDTVLDSEDMWLVEFYAPWCGHCKALAPEWAKAATQLKGKVKLGALDATVHTVTSNGYQIRGFPTIKLFPAGVKDGQAVDYDGGRTASDIVTWALDRVAANIPPPEVVEITSQKVFDDACADHQLCVISVLPQLYDCQSDCRNEYISSLRKLGEKYKKNMWGWVWTEAGAYPELEEALRIGGFGYPAMAALNIRKMAFSWLRGAFSDTGLNEFLRTVASGRGTTNMVKNNKLPDLRERDAWDGQDAVIEMEEEIDLSDVELDPLDSEDTMFHTKPRQDEL